MNTLKNVLAAVLVVCCVAGVAFGEKVAVTPTTVTIIDNGPFALGWAFTVNEDISVTSLGAFDIAGDGIPDGQQARIYDSTNDSVLITVPIDASSTLEPVGGYDVYYTSIEPLILTTGTEYIVAVSNGTNNDIMNSTSLTHGAEIAPVGGRATLFDPNLPASVGGFIIAGDDPQDLYMGAQIKYNPVPEPGTLMLLGLGLLTVLAVSRRSMHG